MFDVIDRPRWSLGGSIEIRHREYSGLAWEITRSELARCNDAAIVAQLAKPSPWGWQYCPTAEERLALLAAVATSRKELLGP